MRGVSIVELTMTPTPTYDHCDYCDRAELFCFSSTPRGSEGALSSSNNVQPTVGSFVETTRVFPYVEFHTYLLDVDGYV